MVLRWRLFKVYWRLERLFGVRVPPHPYEDVLEQVVSPATLWLDIGCGHQVLADWMFDAEVSLVGRAGRITGLDPFLPSLKVHRSITRCVCGELGGLPFPDGAFNLVTARMVMEHLDRPAEAFREVARVLAPGGRFVFQTPHGEGYTVRLLKLLPDWLKVLFAGPMERRGPEDIFPTRYRANDERAIRALAADAGLDGLELRHVLSVALFSLIPPLAALELAWMRLLLRPSMARWRPQIIAILRKPADAAECGPGRLALRETARR